MEHGFAAAQVFNTAELLEMILLSCPTTTIPTAQRVGRSWRATIMGSPKLQKTLFMQPHCFEQHASLQSTYLPICDLGGYVTGTTIDELKAPLWSSKPELLIMNPLLTTILPIGAADEFYDELFTYAANDASTNYNNSVGSWKQMFLTQPPTKRAWIDPHFLASRPAVAEACLKKRLRMDPSSSSLGVKKCKRPIRVLTEWDLTGVEWRRKEFVVENQGGVTVGDVVAALPEALERSRLAVPELKREKGAMLFMIRAGDEIPWGK